MTDLFIVETKYCGPTDRLGSRIRCFSSGCTPKFYPYDNSVQDPHLHAAERYLADLQLKGEYLGYDMAKGSGKLIVYRLK